MVAKGDLPTARWSWRGQEKADTHAGPNIGCDEFGLRRFPKTAIAIFVFLPRLFVFFFPLIFVF
jgi:hypothetical protein